MLRQKIKNKKLNTAAHTRLELIFPATYSPEVHFKAKVATGKKKPTKKKNANRHNVKISVLEIVMITATEQLEIVFLKNPKQEQ